MFTPEISLIAALDEMNGIGKNGQLLFQIPDDLKRFKQLTLGHPIIMGRKTFDSIGKPLPGRTNIVITRNPEYQPAGITIVHSLDEALKQAAEVEQQEIFVIGGAQIYTQAINRASRLYLTLVEGDYRADTFFPTYEFEFSAVVFREDRGSAPHRYSWITLQP